MSSQILKYLKHRRTRTPTVLLEYLTSFRIRHVSVNLYFIKSDNLLLNFVAGAGIEPATWGPKPHEMPFLHPAIIYFTIRQRTHSTLT